MDIQATTAAGALRQTVGEPNPAKLQTTKPSDTLAKPGPEPSPPANSERLEDEAFALLKKQAEAASYRIEFSVDEDTGRTLLKIIDPENHEVLRQIPSAEAIALTRALDAMQGWLIELKA